MENIDILKTIAPIVMEHEQNRENILNYTQSLTNALTEALSKQLVLPLVSTSTLDDEKTPYCTDCGNDDLDYIDQYANGEYWKCKECGKEFIW